MMSRTPVRYIRCRFPVWVGCPFSGDPDVDVLGDRFSSVLLGYGHLELVIQYAL